MNPKEKDSRNDNGKRWGNKFIDNRDWASYNEELVVRGEFLLPIDMFDELETMNEGKRGRPYEFPESFIKVQAIWHQWIDYRGLEGVARSLEKLGLIPYHDDCTTIWHRIHDMNPEIKLPLYDEVEAGSDGTGFKTGCAGEYRTFVYGNIRKKYVKVTITADVRSKKLLAVEAHIEGGSEPQIAVKHLQMLKGIKLKKFYGDGAYDTNEMFNAIGDTESVIKIRKNASTYHCRGSRRRRQEIRKYMGYKEWAKETGYGIRWAVEGIFSSVKRKFGEDLRARSQVGLIAEAMQKMWAYDEMVGYAKNAIMVAN